MIILAKQLTLKYQKVNVYMKSFKAILKENLYLVMGIHQNKIFIFKVQVDKYIKFIRDLWIFVINKLSYEGTIF